MSRDIKEMAAMAARAAGEAIAEIAWANALDANHRDSAFARRMHEAEARLVNALADMKKVTDACERLPARPIEAAPR